LLERDCLSLRFVEDFRRLELTFMFGRLSV
jgi:hypothetical protein